MNPPDPSPDSEETPSVALPVARALRTRQSTGQEMIYMAGAGAVALVLLVVFAVAWLGGPSMLHMLNKVQDAAVQPKRLQPPPPLTSEQHAALSKFGQELARSINTRNISKLAAQVDDEALSARVLEKLPDAFEEPGVRAKLADILRGSSGTWMLQTMGGEAEYVRSRSREDFPTVLLRTGRGWENYVDVMVRPEGEGFRVVDAFSHVEARTASDEICHTLASAARDPDSAAVASLPGMPPDASQEVLRQLPDYLVALRARTALEQLQFCDALPQDAQKVPLFFSLRLQVLQRLNTVNGWENAGDYKAALRAAPGILGPDCTADLLLADVLRMENDFAGVDECLKRAALAIGGADSHLTFRRADNCLIMRNHFQALALLDLVAKDPAWAKRAADLRIKIYLDQRDYPALVETLRAFKNDFGVALGRHNYFVRMDVGEFLASPEFLAWEKETTTGGVEPR